MPKLHNSNDQIQKYEKRVPLAWWNFFAALYCLYLISLQDFNLILWFNMFRPVSLSTKLQSQPGATQLQPAEHFPHTTNQDLRAYLILDMP